MQKITDDILDNTCLLAKLSLEESQQKQMKADLEEVLEAFDQLQEVDTTGVEPLVHILSMNNVYRDDVLRPEPMDGSADTLSGAPKQKNNLFVVPKTIG